MIIGLAGLAGAGKTTVAKHLVEHHGYVRLPFAGPIKAMAEAFGLTFAEVHGFAKEDPCDALCGKTPRQFMQWLGTEFGRDMIGPDVWINAWQRKVFEARNAALLEGDTGVAARSIYGLRVVADDCRFDNEAAAIRAMGGRVIRVHRPGAGSASGAGHSSEGWRGTPDAIIANVRDEAWLRAEADRVVSALRARRDADDESWAMAAAS
jgi:hypothetical protein